ncbi:sugar ABC transporter substrate-binding protein [Gracilibacillus caseinilyticus]|uniref:Sugar ABC transporter substrate-binding protein n=1 Tax=Gracilibacillus caseinilyticus TaxID=2932256 RepID=A0ABY4EZP8_9BACI|nr:sugar ABC transporter substrate-binding protein [Gracilibacillus caseinilyticus]UOQ47651.1 sugar ABC transporter substrate-binding protein [Gracilibacillus caseinilyticus]
MKKKLLPAFLSFVFILSLLLAGCSGDSPTGNDTENSDSEQVTINLGYYSGGKSDEKMQELINRFMEQHPNIKITTQSSPYGQFFQKLDTQIAADEAPDVWLSDGVLVMKYAERGAIKDLTEWINRDLNKEDYYGLDSNQDTDGKYWGVPQGIQIGALYYNKELFDKAGVEYPSEDWTWEDLKEAAAKLTLDASDKKPNEDGFNSENIKQFGLTFFSITEGWFSVLKSYGGGILDESLNNSVINSEENKQAFEWMVDGMSKGIITDPADLNSFQSPMAVFPSGSAAMRIGIYARVLAANEAGLNYDVTVLPKGPDGERFSPVITNSWVINNSTSDKKAEAAWEWVKFWATEDEVQKEWAALGEAVPVKKSVAQSDTFLNSTDKPENKQAFLESFDFAGSLDTNAVWSEWVAKFNEHARRAFLEEQPIEEALENADKDVQKILTDFYNE